ncbi:MAG: fibronectin type III domain-containing protein [Butyrivibrio sp.]|nr:fibronectin type III domain-containing protein [Butyrivibrio sp.]
MNNISKLMTKIILSLSLVLLLAGMKNVEVKAAQTAQTQDSVTIDWSCSYNVSNYYIGISTDYTEAKTNALNHQITVAPSTTSYTFTGLAAGTEYRVYVYADYTTKYGRSYTNEYIAGQTICTLPTKITDANQEKWWYWALAVDVTWTDQPACNYEYEFLNAKGNTVLSSGTTYSVGASMSQIKNNKTYQFRVRPYVTINNVNYYADWSDNVYLFSQPMIKSNGGVKVRGGKLVVKWDKNTDIDGYRIYVSTNEKTGYRLVKTLKKANKSSATISKFKKKSFNNKKTYYVYVQAYKNVDGRTYTSGMHYVTSIKKGKTTLIWYSK